MSNKTVYYSDELNDDFAGISRAEKIIEENYRYVNKNIIWRALEFLTYRVIMTPVAYFYCKLKYGVKFINRKILRQEKRGYYLFGNHTQVPGDGYFPTLLTFPRKTHVIVNPDSVALKGTEQFMLMIGAIPTPSKLHGFRNFENALNERISQGRCITVYPEAHIWPYCTFIRNFSGVSFKYPANCDAPVYCFTVTYRKRRFRKTPGVTIYTDGPISVDENLHPRMKAAALRDAVYSKMCECAKNNEVEFISYVKKIDDTADGADRA